MKQVGIYIRDTGDFLAKLRAAVKVILVTGDML